MDVNDKGTTQPQPDINDDPPTTVNPCLGTEKEKEILPAPMEGVSEESSSRKASTPDPTLTPPPTPQRKEDACPVTMELRKIRKLCEVSELREVRKPNSQPRLATSGNPPEDKTQQTTEGHKRQRMKKKKKMTLAERIKAHRDSEAHHEATINKILRDHAENVAQIQQRFLQETQEATKRARVEPQVINSSNFINPQLLASSANAPCIGHGNITMATPMNRVQPSYRQVREERPVPPPVGPHPVHRATHSTGPEIIRNFSLNVYPEPVPFLTTNSNQFRCVSEARLSTRLPVKLVKSGLGLNSLQPHMIVPPFSGIQEIALHERGRRSTERPTYQQGVGAIPLIQTPESQCAILLAPNLKMVCSRGLAGSHEPWTLTTRFSGQNPNNEEVKGLVLIPKGIHLTGQNTSPAPIVLLDQLTPPLKPHLLGRDMSLKDQDLSLSRAGPLDRNITHVPVSPDIKRMVRTSARKAETNRDYARFQSQHLDTLGHIYYTAFDRTLVVNMAPRPKSTCVINGCAVMAAEWTDLKVHLAISHPMYKPWHCPRPGCSYDCLTLAQLLYHARMIHSTHLKLLLEERFKNCQRGCGYIQDTHDVVDYREHRAIRHEEKAYICACCRLGYVDELAWIHHHWPSFIALTRVDQVVEKLVAAVNEKITTLGREYVHEGNGEEKEIGLAGGNCQNFPNSIPL